MDMDKKKRLIISGVTLLIILIAGTTYAILTWTSSKINLGLTSGCFTIDYTKGNDIANASIKTIDENELISNNKFTIKEGIALTYANIGIKSSCTIEGYGSLYLNVTSLSSAFTTGSSRGSLKYAVLNNTSTTSTITVASLLNQSFDIVANGSITSTGTITLLTKQLSNTSVNKYLIVVYIDDNMVGNDAIGASFSGTVSADANQGKMPITTAEAQLQNLNLVVSSGTPNFTKTSTADGTNGIYAAEDDLGTSYYFRGNVTNNYVKFANKYWRIIRINGDGSIRMIYAGTSAHANGYDDSSTRDMDIGNSAFNSNKNDNTYVGYMYGTVGASTYASTHSNTNNSTIKTKLDSWYDTNIVNTDNEKYIADSIYCNDRSISSGTGIGTTATAYAGQTRQRGTPTLKCVNKADRFTKSTSFGNEKLTKMIGLITLDEVMYAGGTTTSRNTEYYLYTKYSYWTMTPNSFAVGNALVGYINNVYLLDSNFVDFTFAVRPVVSLVSSAISGGSGTMTDPFIVG